jgi:hypothetical protein
MKQKRRAYKIICMHTVQTETFPPYDLGGLRTVHRRFVVDGQLFVQSDSHTASGAHHENTGWTHNGPGLATTLAICTRERSEFAADGYTRHPCRGRLEPLPSVSAKPFADPQDMRVSLVKSTNHSVRQVLFALPSHPRFRGTQLLSALGPNVANLLDLCIVRQQTMICLVEPVKASWGGFSTATLLMLLGVPATLAAAALAEVFAPLDRHESQRRQGVLLNLLSEMERFYGSSVRFALAHGCDASLIGELRFSYLTR